jgi:hypothetical protein
MGWYVKHVLGLNAREKWLLVRGANDWTPLDSIFVDRGDHALPIYPANQPLSVVLTFTDEEMEGVGEWEESLFTPRVSASASASVSAAAEAAVVEPVDPPAPAPVPVDCAFLSHLPKRSISARVSRLKLLPNGLKLFAAINGRIETGFEFKEMRFDSSGSHPVLGYRHLPTKLKSSLEDAPELLARVFDLPDYEEPPDMCGISVFWVQEGNFKNSRLTDLLDWLDDADLPTVGLEEVKEDPLVAARARLEAEWELIQAELDKKRSEIAALKAVKAAQDQFAVDERRRAVSRKELELAEAKAKSMVPY